MYNEIKKPNINAGIVVIMSGVDVNNIPRFRDAWFTNDGKNMIILTRTGGSNASKYESENEMMRNTNNYISDFDDDYDNTFRHFRYSVPEEISDDVTEVAHVTHKIGEGEETCGPSNILKLISGELPKFDQEFIKSIDHQKHMDRIDRIIKYCKSLNGFS